MASSSGRDGACSVAEIQQLLSLIRSLQQQPSWMQTIKSLIFGSSDKQSPALTHELDMLHTSLQRFYDRVKDNPNLCEASVMDHVNKVKALLHNVTAESVTHISAEMEILLSILRRQWEEYGCRHEEEEKHMRNLVKNMDLSEQKRLTQEAYECRVNKHTYPACSLQALSYAVE